MPDIDFNITFREAPSAPVAQVQEKPSGLNALPEKVFSTEDLPPITDYETKQGHPFIVDYLGITPIWPLIVKDKQAGPLKEIDEFVKKEIINNNMRDTANSYKEILRDLEKRMVMKADENVYTKIKALKAYIRALDNRRHNQTLRKKFDMFLKQNNA